LIGAALCLALAVIEWGAWTLVLPGRRLTTPESQAFPWESIEIRASDDIVLSGVFHESKKTSNLAAVLIHGFGEDRSAMLERAELLMKRDWNVAAIDARGRGRSEGDRTSFGGREADDLRAWLDALSCRLGTNPRFVAWGRSMGAAVAIRAAVEDSRIVALVLESPYADLRVTVAAWLRRWRLSRHFVGPMLRRARRLAGVSLHQPRPIDMAPLVKIPVLILHGSADPIVSQSEMQRLATAFAGPVEVIVISEAAHHNVLSAGGEDLSKRVETWINSIFMNEPG